MVNRLAPSPGILHPSAPSMVARIGDYIGSDNKAFVRLGHGLPRWRDIYDTIKIPTQKWSWKDHRERRLTALGASRAVQSGYLVGFIPGAYSLAALDNDFEGCESTYEEYPGWREWSLRTPGLGKDHTCYHILVRACGCNLESKLCIYHNWRPTADGVSDQPIRCGKGYICLWEPGVLLEMLSSGAGSAGATGVNGSSQDQ